MNYAEKSDNGAQPTTKYFATILGGIMVVSYGVTAAVYGAMAWVRSEAMCNLRVAEQRDIYREVVADQNKRIDRLLK